MRVLLIDNLLYEDVGGAPKYELQPHAGLMSLVAVARAGGHEASVLDPKWELSQGRLRLDASLYDELAEDIVRRDPDVVGFTALGCNFALVVRVAGEVRRRRPGLPILLGGPQASILHREILEGIEAFDVIARNEAEDTLLPLLDGLEGRRFGDLPGVSYRTAGGKVVCNPGSPNIEDLDGLPFPAYDAYPIREAGLKRIRIEAGRGCPFSCTFCSTATFFGRRYRIKSAPRLVAEMDHLNRAYGFAQFDLTHDLFTVNRKKILEFCRELGDRQYKWSCSARADCVDEELLREMARAGCNGIYFGIETGSPRMQAISQKRLDLDLVEPMVSLAIELDIDTTTSFITGYPEEDADDQAATIDFATRMLFLPGNKTATQLHMLTPEPGTALIAQYGDRMRFDGHLTDFNFPLLDEADNRTVEGNPDMFPNYQYYPTVLPRHRHIFAIAAFRGLQEVARSILRYLLRAYGGRTSALIEAADAWRVSQGLAPSSVDPEFFVRFAAARFGADHHMVSMLRYAVAIARVRTAARRQREPGAALRPDAPLRLGRCVEILTRIHHVPALLKQAEATDALLDDGTSGATTQFLVMSDLKSDRISTSEIDEVTARHLARFSAPKRYRQFRREIARAGEEIAWTWPEVRELCEGGVLEAAG